MDFKILFFDEKPTGRLRNCQVICLLLSDKIKVVTCRHSRCILIQLILREGLLCVSLRLDLLSETWARHLITVITCITITQRVVGQFLFLIVSYLVAQ